MVWSTDMRDTQAQDHVWLPRESCMLQWKATHNPETLPGGNSLQNIAQVASEFLNFPPKFPKLLVGNAKPLITEVIEVLLVCQIVIIRLSNGVRNGCRVACDFGYGTCNVLGNKLGAYCLKMSLKCRQLHCSITVECANFSGKFDIN